MVSVQHSSQAGYIVTFSGTSSAATRRGLGSSFGPIIALGSGVHWVSQGQGTVPKCRGQLVLYLTLLSHFGVLVVHALCHSALRSPYLSRGSSHLSLRSSQGEFNFDHVGMCMRISPTPLPNILGVLTLVSLPPVGLNEGSILGLPEGAHPGNDSNSFLAGCILILEDSLDRILFTTSLDCL